MSLLGETERAAWLARVAEYAGSGHSVLAQPAEANSVRSDLLLFSLGASRDLGALGPRGVLAAFVRGKTRSRAAEAGC